MSIWRRGGDENEEDGRAVWVLNQAVDNDDIRMSHHKYEIE